MEQPSPKTSCAKELLIPSITSQKSKEGLITKILDRNEVKFNLLLTVPKMPSELHLPYDMDINNPYNLFTLFFPKDLWSTIAVNTNQYAKLKNANTAYDKSGRHWWDINTAELKVFIGILIYMGVHQSPAIEHY